MKVFLSFIGVSTVHVQGMTASKKKGWLMALSKIIYTSHLIYFLMPHLEVPNFCKAQKEVVSDTLLIEDFVR